MPLKGSSQLTIRHNIADFVDIPLGQPKIVCLHVKVMNPKNQNSNCATKPIEHRDGLPLHNPHHRYYVEHDIAAVEDHPLHSIICRKLPKINPEFVEYSSSVLSIDLTSSTSQNWNRQNDRTQLVHPMARPQSARFRRHWHITNFK